MYEKFIVFIYTLTNIKDLIHYLLLLLLTPMIGIPVIDIFCFIKSWVSQNPLSIIVIFFINAKILVSICWKIGGLAASINSPCVLMLWALRWMHYKARVCTFPDNNFFFEELVALEVLQSVSELDLLFKTYPSKK